MQRSDDNKTYDDNAELQLVRNTDFQYQFANPGHGQKAFNYAEATNTIQFNENTVIKNVRIVRFKFETPDSGKQLAQLVKTKGITRLNLFDCALSDEAVEAYSNELLEGKHNLYCLELDGSGVTENTLKKYRMANPNSPFAVVCVMENQNNEAFWHLDGDYKAIKKPIPLDKLSWFALKVVAENNLPTHQLTNDLKEQVQFIKDYEKFRQATKN